MNVIEQKLRNNTALGTKLKNAQILGKKLLSPISADTHV